MFKYRKNRKISRDLYCGAANICIFSEFQVSTEKKLDMKHESDRLDRPVFILVLVFVYFMIIIKNVK
jgi:hypothetical protein